MQSIDLPKRSDIHWARKFWHMGAVFLMFSAYQLTPSYVSTALLAIGWLLFVPMDYMRLSRPSLNQKVISLFSKVIRESEAHRLAGTTYLLTGTAIIVTLFPHVVVALTLLFLAFADPVASIVGIKFGKDKIFGHKSIQGFLAAFFVCFLVSWFYLIHLDIDIQRALVCSLIAGLIAALAELIPIGRLDDNLTLPVISATGLHVLFYFFGFYPVLG